MRQSAWTLRPYVDLGSISGRDLELGPAIIHESPRQRQIVRNGLDDMVAGRHHGEHKSAGGVGLHGVPTVQYDGDIGCAGLARVRPSIVVGIEVHDPRDFTRSPAGGPTERR